MIRNNSPSDGSTSTMGNKFAAFIAAVSTIAVVAVGVTYTTPFISSQFSTPAVPGTLGTIVSIGLLTIGVVVGLLFTAVVVLGLVNAYAEPELFGYSEYQVFGAAGVIGAVLAVAYNAASAVPEVAEALPTTPETSIGAVALLAVPLAASFYEIAKTADTGAASRSSANQNTDDSRPDVPRAGPVDWDRDPPKMHETGDTQTTNNRHNETWDTENTESQEDDQPTDTQTQEKQTIDDLEFRWVTETDVSFNDVGGMSDVKSELERDVVKPMTTGKDKAEALGIPVPNILFHGPPGTGKTFMAKALATELGLPFAKLSGADMQSKWINESATKVNQLFDEAKRIAEVEGGAVVFIDELDSVLRSRDGDANAHAEDQKVVNEFLNQLGDTEDYDIVFIGATNRPDILDEAGTRSGRIDTKIEIGKPDADARRSIIKAQLDDKPHSLGDDAVEEFVERTEGLVAADIHGIVMEAARESAFGRDDDVIQWQDVEKAL